MACSTGRKSASLTRMLPPNSLAIRPLSLNEGISEAKLDRWRDEAPCKGQLINEYHKYSKN